MHGLWWEILQKAFPPWGHSIFLLSNLQWDLTKLTALPGVFEDMVGQVPTPTCSHWGVIGEYIDKCIITTHLTTEPGTQNSKDLLCRNTAVRVLVIQPFIGGVSFYWNIGEQLACKLLLFTSS